MKNLNRILKFYAQSEISAFVVLLGEDNADKLLLASIDKIGAFYAISNPCKVENAIKQGTKIGGNYDSADNQHTAKGLTEDKLYGFIQFDGIKRSDKPLRIYADVKASGGFFWKKGQSPKTLKLGVNKEGVFCEKIAF